MLRVKTLLQARRKTFETGQAGLIGAVLLVSLNAPCAVALMANCWWRGIVSRPDAAKGALAGGRNRASKFRSNVEAFNHE